MQGLRDREKGKRKVEREALEAQILQVLGEIENRSGPTKMVSAGANITPTRKRRGPFPDKKYALFAKG